jgi:hypothetical protein
MSLELLISPTEIASHEHELIFRLLFIYHMNSELNEILSFLDSKNLKTGIEIGSDENNETIAAISVDGKNIIGFKEN